MFGDALKLRIPLLSKQPLVSIDCEAERHSLKNDTSFLQGKPLSNVSTLSGRFCQKLLKKNGAA